MLRTPLAITRSAAASALPPRWVDLLPPPRADHALFVASGHPEAMAALSRPQPVFPLSADDPLRALALAALTLRGEGVASASVLASGPQGEAQLWTLCPLHALAWGTPVVAVLREVRWGEFTGAERLLLADPQAPLASLDAALESLGGALPAPDPVALHHAGVTLLLAAPLAAPGDALRAEAEALLASLRLSPSELGAGVAALQAQVQEAHALYLDEVESAHGAFLSAALAALTARPRQERDAPDGAPRAAQARALQRLDAPAPRFALPHLRLGAQVLVLDEPTELTQAIVVALRQQGVEASRASSLPEDTRGVDVILLARGMHPVDHLEDALELVHHVREVVRRLGAQPAGHPRALITLHDTRGTFGHDATPEPHRAPLAAIPAVARALRDMDPLATVRSLDLERGARSPATLGRLVVSELLQGGPEPLVGLRSNGARSTLHPVPIPPEGAPLRAPRARLAFMTLDPVGVERLLARQRATPAPLVLITPTRAEALAESLRACGAPVHVIPALFRRVEAITAAVERARELVGPLEEAVTLLPRRLDPADAPSTLRALLHLLHLLQQEPLSHLHLLLPADTADDAPWRAELATLEASALYARAWLPEAAALTISHIDPHQPVAPTRLASPGERLEIVEVPPAVETCEVGVLLGSGLAPGLADATLWGRPTLPVAWVIEWFVRFAWTLLPHLHFTALTQLRVLRELRLPRRAEESPRLLLRGRAVEHPEHRATLRVALVDAAGEAWVEAEVHLDDADGALPILMPMELPRQGAPRIDAARWASAEGSGLGPRLHALHPLEVSPRAASAHLAPDLQLWAAPTWTEPALLDALLQQALWWHMEARSERAQIARIGRLIIAGRPSPRAEHQGLLLAAGEAHADLQALDASGAVLLQALDVHLQPVSAIP